MFACCWCGDGVADVLTSIETTLETGKNEKDDDDKQTVALHDEVHEITANISAPIGSTTVPVASTVPSVPVVQPLPQLQQRSRERSLTIDATTTTSADATITTPSRIPDEVPLPQPSAIDSCISLFKDTADD